MSVLSILYLYMHIHFYFQGADKNSLRRAITCLHVKAHGKIPVLICVYVSTSLVAVPDNIRCLMPSAMKLKHQDCLHVSQFKVMYITHIRKYCTKHTLTCKYAQVFISPNVLTIANYA